MPTCSVIIPEFRSVLTDIFPFHNTLLQKKFIFFKKNIMLYIRQLMKVAKKTSKKLAKTFGRN